MDQIPSIITSNLSSHPKFLETIFLIAFEMAKSQNIPLGIMIRDDLRDEIMSIIPTAVKEDWCIHDNSILDGIIITQLKEGTECNEFNGIILLIVSSSSDIDLIKSIKRASFIAVPRSNIEYEELISSFPDTFHLIMDNKFRPTKSQNNDMAWFEEHYDMLFKLITLEMDKIELGDSIDKKCRYCGKTDKETTFKNISHAFPELMGNKKIIDLLECDACNKHFSEMLDNDLANWLQITRSLIKTKGKNNKIPNYKHHVNGRIAEIKNDNQETIIKIPEEHFSIDLEKHEFILRLVQPSYVPIAVFKSFIKMALAVMPELCIQECEHLKTWILEKEHTYADFLYFKPELFVQFIPGPINNNILMFSLLKRKSNKDNCPYLVFVLQYANYIYQIILPMPSKDYDHKKSHLQFRYFINPCDYPEYQEKYGNIQRYKEPLDSLNKEKGNPISMKFGFEHAIEITKE
jgi:hypothetical protein